MKTRSLVFAAGLVACAGAATLIVACAAESGKPSSEEDAAEASTETGEDAGIGDADADVEIEPCDDCMYFPETCSSDALCDNGPFNPKTQGGAFDGRTQINVIRGRSADDVWAIGAIGAVAHFDGSSWTRMDLGVRDSMRALWLRDSAEVALSTFDTLYARGLAAVDAGPDGWGKFKISSSANDFGRIVSLQYAWGAPDGSSFWCALVNNEYLTSLWRLRLAPSMDRFELVHAIPPGVAPPSSRVGQTLAIHGASGNDLWAVGTGGSTLHITDAETDTPTLTTFDSRTWNALRGVWALSETEAWSVGEGGVIRHYTGDPLRWDIVPDIPASANFNAVWGASSSDVWAVGDRGVAFHYDGKSWSRMKIAGLGTRRPNLTTVWTPAPGHVWIGGEGFVLSLGGRP